MTHTTKINSALYLLVHGAQVSPGINFMSWSQRQFRRVSCCLILYTLSRTFRRKIKLEEMLWLMFSLVWRVVNCPLALIVTLALRYASLCF